MNRANRKLKEHEPSSVRINYINTPPRKGKKGLNKAIKHGALILIEVENNNE